MTKHTKTFYRLGVPQAELVWLSTGEVHLQKLTTRPKLGKTFYATVQALKTKYGKLYTKHLLSDKETTSFNRRLGAVETKRDFAFVYYEL